MDANTDESNSSGYRRPQQRLARIALLLVAFGIAYGVSVAAGPADEGAAHLEPLPLSHPSVIAAFCVLLLSLALSALLSLAEIAIVSVNRVRVKRLADDGDPRAEALLDLYDDEDSSYLSGIMIGIAVLIIVMANGTAWIILRTGLERYAVHASVIQISVALLFGEVIPKTLGAHQPERYALALSRLVRWIVRSGGFRVGLGIVNGISRPIRRIFGVADAVGHYRVSQEELEALTDVAEEEGVLEASEAQMIDGIISFRELNARDIMVSRMDVVAIEASRDIGEAADTIAREGKSRIPIYEGDRDHVVGVLYSHDVLARLALGEHCTAGELAREPVLVPETMRIDDLLRLLLQRKVHIALVIDEHGGFDGIVTIEDILEEIVGGIHDEHDYEEEQIIRLSEDEWRVQGATPKHAVEAALDIELPDGEFDTVAGFIVTTMGSLPDPGERIVHEGHAFIVGQVEGTRLRTVRVERLPEDELRDEEENNKPKSGTNRNGARSSGNGLR